MKWVCKLMAVAGLLLLGAGIVQAQESLGAAARELKQTDRPHAKKVFTNDDLSAQSVPAASESAPEADDTKKPAAKAAPQPKEGAKTPFPLEELKKRNEAYRAKLEAQKDNIALLEREITVAKRELQVQTALYYADAGNRLRDPQDWEKNRSSREAEIAAKQQQLDEANKKLDDIREEARKAGVPAVFVD